MHRREFLTSTLAFATGLSAARGQSTSPPAANQNRLADWRTELSRHRVVDLTTSAMQMQWPRLVGRNARLGVHGRGPRVNVCRLRTDRGASGWGVYAGNPQGARDLLDRVRNLPLTEMFDPAVGITQRWLHRPLDFALHDLAGQILRIPVYEMLGGHGPASSPCYSGMIYFDDIEPLENPPGIDRVLENCRADHQLGYRQLKAKIGRGHRWMERRAGIQRDIDVTRQIARNFPDVRILVDANDGYTPDDFFTYLEGIGDIELLWIEEPFRENVEHFRRLHGWLRSRHRLTLLADGEANPDWPVLHTLHAERLLDVQLVDVQSYGFTSWRALLPKLRRQSAQGSPHTFGHQLKTYYTAHLARGLGNIVTIEGVTCSCDQIDFGQYTLRDGQLTPSPAAGFGMTLNLRE